MGPGAVPGCGQGQISGLFYVCGQLFGGRSSTAHPWASSIYLRHWKPQDPELSMTWKDTGSCLQEHRGRLQLCRVPSLNSAVSTQGPSVPLAPRLQKKKKKNPWVLGCCWFVRGMAWFDGFTRVLLGIAGVGGGALGWEHHWQFPCCPGIKRPEQADFASLPFHTPCLALGEHLSTHTALSGQKVTDTVLVMRPDGHLTLGF